MLFVLIAKNLFRTWQVPYYWLGVKLYDFVSGKRVLRNSFYISKENALERFPMLKRDSLKGALIYYDGKYYRCLIATPVYFDFRGHSAQNFLCRLGSEVYRVS